MTFEEFCAGKKIDACLFKKMDSNLFEELKIVFDQVSPASFNQQKLFLINGLRHDYPFKESELPETKQASPMAKMKPKIPLKSASPKIPKPRS